MAKVIPLFSGRPPVGLERSLTVDDLRCRLADQEAAIKALNDIDAFKLNLSKILKEKKWMYKQLIDVEAVKELFFSDANFILIKAQDSKGLSRYLISKKIHVRDRTKQISNTLRITIGTRAENKLLINTIREYYG